MYFLQLATFEAARANAKYVHIAVGTQQDEEGAIGHDSGLIPIAAYAEVMESVLASQDGKAPMCLWNARKRELVVIPFERITNITVSFS